MDITVDTTDQLIIEGRPWKTCAALTLGAIAMFAMTLISWNVMPNLFAILFFFAALHLTAMATTRMHRTQAIFAIDRKDALLRWRSVWGYVQHRVPVGTILHADTQTVINSRRPFERPVLYIDVDGAPCTVPLHPTYMSDHSARRIADRVNSWLAQADILRATGSLDSNAGHA
ncbi:hypothetical protein [Nereida sp. MMG025]|uniref:hypothetical protein n=1 Tax=Nereida sp. MMG025 TaxID=2909981 RepID=UPI001F2B9E51|nr:hypothetical protein [Nereida sp. MMG025]MCF6444199.1 hypothetical protein [Nereida sp. MMG025]